jgi:receptor protein-tyrosine kinase
VLDVSYDSASRAQAVTILSHISRVFSSLVDKRLGVRSGRSVFGSRNPLPVIVVSEFDPPHLEPEAVSPKPVKTLGFAGAFGLALGLVLAFARESLDDRLRSRKDAEEWYGAPVVGTLPKAGRSDPGLGLDGRRSDASLIQALQLLRANLQFSQAGIGGPTLLITSATSHEGKTTVAGSLAASLALGGNRVVCIEGDLRKPNLNRFLGVEPNAHGLVDVLEGDVELDTVVQPIDLGPSTNGNSAVAGTNGSSADGASGAMRGSLHLLSSGRLPLDPATILTPERVSDLIGRLRSNYDYVIIDGPPLSIPDAFPLALAADDVLVVARRGRTIRHSAETARTVLQRLGVESVGVVLTNAPPSETHAYA